MSVRHSHARTRSALDPQILISMGTIPPRCSVVIDEKLGWCQRAIEALVLMRWVLTCVIPGSTPAFRPFGLRRLTMAIQPHPGQGFGFRA